MYKVLSSRTGEESKGSRSDQLKVISRLSVPIRCQMRSWRPYKLEMK